MLPGSKPIPMLLKSDGPGQTHTLLHDAAHIESPDVYGDDGGSNSDSTERENNRFERRLWHAWLGAAEGARCWQRLGASVGASTGWCGAAHVESVGSFA